MSRISTASWASWTSSRPRRSAGSWMVGRIGTGVMAPMSAGSVAGFGRGDGPAAPRVMIGSQSVGSRDGSAQSVNLSLTGRVFPATGPGPGVHRWRSSSSMACGPASRTESSPPPTRATTTRGPASTRPSSRRPSVIVRVRTVDDVVAAVVAAGDLGLPIAVRGGGHSVAGHSMADGALVVDLREMRAVSVDPKTRIVRVRGRRTLGRPRRRPPGRTTSRSSAGRSATPASRA